MPRHDGPGDPVRHDGPVRLPTGYGGGELTALAHTVVATKRHGDDLILFLNDGEKLILRGYFVDNSADGAVLPPADGHNGATGPDHGTVGHFTPVAAPGGAPDLDTASEQEGLSPLIAGAGILAGAGLLALVAGAGGGGGTPAKGEHGTTPKKIARIHHDPAPVHGSGTITGSDQHGKSLEAGQSSVVKAGPGNDIITVTAADFKEINGGSGLDTAVFAYESEVLNREVLAKLRSIERLDLGEFYHALALNPALVQGMTDDGNTLRIDTPYGRFLKCDPVWTECRYSCDPGKPECSAEPVSCECLRHDPVQLWGGFVFDQAYLYNDVSGQTYESFKSVTDDGKAVTIWLNTHAHADCVLMGNEISVGAKESAVPAVATSALSGAQSHALTERADMIVVTDNKFVTINGRSTDGRSDADNVVHRYHESSNNDIVFFGTRPDDSVLTKISGISELCLLNDQIDSLNIDEKNGKKIYR